MLRKATFLTGFCFGYVLGARAGRERYEQICRVANRVWENPQVQKVVGQVEGRAAETAKTTAHELQHKAGDTARSVLSTAKGKVAQARHRTGVQEGETVGPRATYEPATPPSAYETPSTSGLTGSYPQPGGNGRLD